MNSRKFRTILCAGFLIFILTADVCLAAHTQNILITGYWPPTNEMLRKFSTNPDQNSPYGWQGQNWEGRGYDVYAFFPEFPGGTSSNPKGNGDFEIDYQDVGSWTPPSAPSGDFWRITSQIHPVAIMSFGQGSGPWEIECNARNLPSSTWTDDYLSPLKPTPAPPDTTQASGYVRHSSLPVEAIAEAVNSSGRGINAWVDWDTDPGHFLCEYMAYHDAWYQSLHGNPNDQYYCVAAGFTHLAANVNVNDGTATACVEAALRALINHLDLQLVQYTISGTVTSGGSPLAGVTMCGLPGNPVTNSSGVYSTPVGGGWSGTVTPLKSGYAFTFAQRTYSNVRADQSAQDYTASTATADTILFDVASSNSSSSPSTTLSWSHTVGSGSNCVLIVGAVCEDATAADQIISSVKFNGVNMTPVPGATKSRGNSSSAVKADLYYMLNPPAGAHTVLITYNGTVSYRAGGAISLKNVKQQAPEVVTTNSATASAISTPVTVPNSGAWIVDVVGNSYNGSFTTSTTTERWDRNSGYHTGAGGTKAVTTPGANTITWTCSGSGAMVHSLAAFAPSETTTAPPGQAGSPSPASGATNVGITTDLSWSAGSGATSHDVYFGTNSGSLPLVSSAQTATTYDTGTISNNITYYWRINEKNAGGTTTGIVWNFTTIVAAPGQASTPNPANLATNVGITTDISWTAGSGATSHDVYFGTSSPGTFRGNQTGTTYDTGIMANGTTYYWRIDEKNAGGTTTGIVWSFTTIQTFTIIASAGSNGSINPSGSIIKDYGTSQLFTATPSTGYTVDKWSVDSVEVQTGGTTYTLSNITATHTVAVSFKILTYTVTASAGANGSISPSGPITKDYGSSQQFTATPSTGYTVDKWSVDSVEVQTGGTTYTLSNITATHTVAVSFKILTYTVTASAGANGTVAPPSAVVNYGGSQLFTATPSTGYQVDKWTVDGGDVQTGGTTYTLSNITATHTVAVSFKILTYTVTASAGANGSISPSGPITKDYGSSQQFTATPTTGYQVDTWSVDSSPVQTGGTTYTLSTITAAHTVAVTFIPIEYTLTINKVGNGTVAKSPDQATYHYGDIVTLTATADAGWTFGAYSGDTTTNTITMNANKTVTATFTQDEYTLTIDKVGSGSVAKSPDQATYHYGDIVTLTATADAGWTFGAYSGDTTTNTITMNGNKTVTATFTQDEYTLTIDKVGSGSVAKSPDQATYHYGDIVTLTATADAGWTFGAYSGDTTTNTITMNGSKTVTATFTQDEYALTINKVGSGSVAKSPDQATYHYGDIVTLTATADAGWTFGAYSGDTTTNTITMNGNKTVTATFTQDEYTLTIDKVGSGSVAKSPDQATYHYGDIVTLTATADAGWTFGAYSGDTTTNTITMNGSKTVTATFTQDEYALTIDKVGSGSVAKSPDQATYHYGDIVTLTATADAGWTFGAYSGDTTTNTITMNASKTVTATFTQDEYTLTIDKVGSGSVAKSPDQATYHYGDIVTLTATADAGWTFGAYSGDTTTNTITMNASKTVTATFTQDEYTLTIDKVGSGSVAKSPDQATYHYGDIVTLTATADAGWTFGAYSGDTTTNTITMNASKTVTATFTLLTYTITASAGANGTIDPVGDVSTDYGSDQMFTATPDTDFEVDKWSVDSVEVQTGGVTYTLSSITAVHTVSVTFKASLPQLPADNFNDNRRGAMWRYYGNANVWMAEDANLLNMGATGAGELPLAGYCVGHWMMNDNVDNAIVADSSGNGNNGTSQQNTSILHTTGKIDGALAFNGASDYVDIGNVIGTGAYTKVAWVKIDSGSYNNNIVSSSNLSHALWAPASRGSRLMAGHFDPGPPDYDHVQDSVALQPDIWYHVAVTFDPDADSGKMVLYKDGSAVDTATNVPTQPASPSVYIGRFYNGFLLKGSIDNVMIFNRALNAEEIAALYNEGNGTETIPAGTPQIAGYTANGWTFDTAGDFEVKVDFHYSGVSSRDGWVGMSIENNGDNYVSLSAGYDSSGPVFYYEKVVNGSMTSGQIARGSNDGTLYISYNASLDELYLSTAAYGSANAWQTIPGLLQGQWASRPVSVTIDGGVDRVAIGSGEAYLDNFEVTAATLNGWPPVTDLNKDGYIDLEDIRTIAENWLDTNPDNICDVYDDDIINFLDFAEIANI